jgi:hypothetical protein
VWTAGQVIGLIHDIPTCEELLQRIEKEAVEAMKQTQALYVTGGTVEKTTNNPGAEVYGIGKSKL